MDNSCKVPEVKPITIKRFGTAGLVPTIPTTSDCNLWQKTDLKDGEFALNTVDDKLYIRSGNEIIELTNQAGSSTSGTVTSVGLTMPSAFLVANSPITTSGIINVSGAGLVSQYIRGDGSLANFPASTGGGASQSFYLNGSVSQGTFGGVAFREMDRVPILGAGTDFTINTNGYIQSFITDAGVPNLLEIPAGNWNFETYFSASSGGGSPSFYLELYKWDGATLSLIASNSATPEGITNGTAIDLYVSTLAVPQTTLLATDRLAVRIYVNNSGRTITLHTENNHLCQVITTFSTGLNALNGLTAQIQTFATGTTGTDFNISSATNTHTFNIPTASASNRGLLSSSDWTTFNNKLSTAITSLNGLTGATQTLATGSTGSDFNIVSSSTAHTFNIPTASGSNRGLLSSSDWSTFNNKQDLLISGTNIKTINGTTLLGSGNLSVGTVTSVAALTLGSSGTDLSSTVANGTTTPVITLNIPTASATNRGVLSSTDWTTFNSKVSSGSVTTSGLTMTTARLLGRSTAGSGAVEEITIGSGLTLSGGTLTAAGGSGITIGTTAIASGTVNRILFEGAGNVVQQDSTFVWNNTDKRLILGTEAVADANTRLVITGSGSGSSTTTFGLKVHNSTGTNNALVVRDDGRVGIGTSNPNSQLSITSTAPTLRIAGIGSTTTTAKVAFQISTNDDAGIESASINAIGISGLYSADLSFRTNSGFIGLATERFLIKFDGSAFVFGNELTANPTVGILRPATNFQVADTTGVNMQISSGYGWNQTGIGSGNTGNIVFLSIKNISSARISPTTTLESARFTNNGNLLIGTATDVTQSILTIASTTKGILIPRMTTSQWDAISSKPQGLQAFDTTQQKPVIICCPTSGINQWTNTTIFTQTATVTISNTTTETSVFTTGIGTRTLPANFLTIGKTIRVKIKGYMNEIITPTIRIRLKFGAVTIYDTTAVTINALGGSDKYFEAEYDITARTLGATGTVFPQGRWIYTANSGIVSVINGVSTSTATVDTTISNTIDLTVEWGTASTSNNVNITNASIEILN